MEEENLETNEPTTLQSFTTFNKDAAGLIISLIIAIIFVIIGEFFFSSGGGLYLIIGLILILYGVFTFFHRITDIRSAWNYKKAQNELDGLYLRRNKPVCPFLRSAYSGFDCQIEFDEPFNIKSDLPKCHLESAYKAHWEEKVPNVFEKAKKSADRNLYGSINLMGYTKYEPAIPFLLDIVDMPAITKSNLFILEQANNISVEDLRNIFIDTYSTADPELNEDKDLEVSKLNTEFDTMLASLTKAELLIVEDDTVHKSPDSDEPSFQKRWKFYSSSLTKQYALAALTRYENPDLVPNFLDIYLNSKNNKLVAISKNALIKLNEYLEGPMLELLNDPNLPSTKKVDIIDLASNVESEKIFDELKALARSEDETLSYYAVSALANYDQEGIFEMLDILSNKPTDLNIDAARATLAKDPKKTFKSIVAYLQTPNEFSTEFIQIVASVLEELDHTAIKEYFNSLETTEQDEIDQLFEKRQLLQQLDYLLE